MNKPEYSHSRNLDTSENWAVLPAEKVLARAEQVVKDNKNGENTRYLEPGHEQALIALAQQTSPEANRAFELLLELYNAFTNSEVNTTLQKFKDRFPNLHFELDEALQLSMSAFRKCVQRFETTKASVLSTYLQRAIYRAVARYCNEVIDMAQHESYSLEDSLGDDGQDSTYGDLLPDLRAVTAADIESRIDAERQISQLRMLLLKRGGRNLEEFYILEGMLSVDGLDITSEMQPRLERLLLKWRRLLTAPMPTKKNPPSS